VILTDEEKRMRDGAEGAATAAAMDLLIRYGDWVRMDATHGLITVLARGDDPPEPPAAELRSAPATDRS
jgi:hypothetical protein